MTTVTTTTKRQGTVNLNEGPSSASYYEQRGLKEVAVDQEHVSHLEVELKRERGVNGTLQEDIKMLRD